MSDLGDWGDGPQKPSSASLIGLDDVDANRDHWGESMAIGGENASSVHKRPLNTTPVNVIKESGEVSTQLDVLMEDITQSSPGLDRQLIQDIPVHVEILVGATKVALRDLLKLNSGSVLELNSMAGNPHPMMVNGKLLALGEIVLVNDVYGFKITELVSSKERLETQKSIM